MRSHSCYRWAGSLAVWRSALFIPYLAYSRHFMAAFRLFSEPWSASGVNMFSQYPGLSIWRPRTCIQTTGNEGGVEIA
jgi:hypothetical protein